METDLRGRVVALEQKAIVSEQKMTMLEQWKAQMDILTARKDEQFNNVIAQIAGLDKKIDDLGGTLKWIGRTIIGGIILGAVGFALKGGFNLPG
ncbi:MAG: hypothetical protein QHC90_13120 [Shinella sp.]|nr:hypothetical protein [Shinella sp.]